MAAVVLGTADGRRADPATPGIRRLVHRPGGVLAHWRRDGCGQPGPGTINARPSAGLLLQRRKVSSLQQIRPCAAAGDAAAETATVTVSYAARTRVIIKPYGTHVDIRGYELAI